MASSGTISGYRLAPRRHARSLDALRGAARKATAAADWKTAYELWLEIFQHGPREVESSGHVALALKSLGRLDESLEYWNIALEMSPQSSGLLGNIAEIYRLQYKMVEAEEAARRALEIHPDRHEIRVGLATSLWDQRKLVESLAECAKVPPEAEAFASMENLRGNIFSLLGDGISARKAYGNALERLPDNPTYHSNFLLSTLYDESLDSSEVYEAHREFGRKYDGVLKKRISDPDPNRTLRIGFLSSDFRLHSVAYFVEPLIEAMDRRRFEVVLYSNVTRPDDMTDVLKEHAAGFVPVNGYSADQFASQCESDHIDILIELNGHTGSNLLPFMAKRPAAVQISWLGYPSTTGMKSIDYRFSDAIIEPKESAQGLSSEVIWHIEDGCHLYRMPGEEVGLEALPMLENGYPTFVSFNNSAKISPTTLGIWARLMREVKNSRLILKNSGYMYPPRQAEIVQFFEAEGVAASRIDFRQLTNTVRKHIELYNEGDIALDTYPYNGTTTTCEALWMGLPVVSLKGDAPASRHTASLLSRVGLEDWVVDSEECYISKVKEMLEQEDVLAELRSSLRGRLKRSPLGHPVHFAARFQAALRRIWAKECAQAGAGQELVDRALAAADSDEALGRASRAVSRAQYFHGVGNLAKAARDWEIAAATGKVAEACVEAAKCLNALGDKKRLRALWQSATCLYPKKPEFWATLAEIEVSSGCMKEAATAYEHALELSPNNPGIWMNLSAVHRSLNASTRAVKAARKAIELKPDFTEGWNNLGAALRDQREFDGAVAAFCEALKFDPRNTEIHANLVYLLNFIPGLSHRELREQMAVFNSSQFDTVREMPSRTSVAKDEGPLRLGFLSSDFRRHSVAYFLRAALPALKLADVEVHVFADVRLPDDLSHELRAQVDRWYWTSQLSDKDLSDHIRSIELDVLIELNGCTAGNRLKMLASRVAPKQGSWLGFPMATECKGIDFFISDELIYPDSVPSVRCLKGCAFPYEIPAELPEVSMADFSAPLTFGAFHNFSKLNSEVWKNWIQVLGHFETSRLLVKSKQLADADLLASLKEELTTLGAPLERIEFRLYAESLSDHLSCYREVDFALDPSPYNGVTTTLEALAMGVPVLSLPGETPASRHTASLLNTYFAGEGVFDDLFAMISHVEIRWKDLSGFRQQRAARHEGFEQRLNAYRPKWADDFLNILKNETKET